MARDWKDNPIYDTVRVWTRTQTGTDPMNEPVYSWSHVDVRGVIVKHGSSQSLRQGELLGKGDTLSDVRPDGTRLSFVLGFPRDYDGPPLKHGRITLLRPTYGMDADETDGWKDALVVIGNPTKNPARPTRWDMLVEVGRVDG